MDKDSMYVKIWNENIKECGDITCGCKIVKVETPHVTLKLCKTHTAEIEYSVDREWHISPMINNPGKFERVHLAAVGSKEFE